MILSGNNLFNYTNILNFSPIVSHFSVILYYFNYIFLSINYDCCLVDCVNEFHFPGMPYIIYILQYSLYIVFELVIDLQEKNWNYETSCILF